MFRLPHIPTSQELIDNAFRAGSKEARKARSTKKRREVRLKQSDLKRVQTATKVIESSLKAVVKRFPSFNSLSPFYQSLLDIKVDRNKYKKSLGAVNWCLKKVDRLSKRELAFIRQRKGTGREFLGRTSSFIKRIQPDLDYLIEVKEVIRNLPSVEDVPTLVVAGFPNVGKSTFVKNLTGSKIAVRHYPFTTKDILIGHVEVKHVRYQIIDIPGLLERPMSKRNKIELQAVTALEHLAEKILFLVDPTQELEPQLGLLEEISKLIKADVFVGVNKVDVSSPETVGSVEKALSGRRVFSFCANNPEECIAVFNWIYGF